MVDDTANSLPSRWTKSFPCPCLGGVAAGGAWSSIGPSRNISRKSCARSEEHTSELQSHVNLVCRLLLEKKKKKGNHQLNETSAKSSIDSYPHSSTSSAES